MRARAGAGAAAAGGGDVSGAMLAPSAANTPVVRVLAVAAAVAAISSGSSVLSNQGAAFVHLLAYGTLLGTLLFNTFVGARWGVGAGAWGQACPLAARSPAADAAVACCAHPAPSPPPPAVGLTMFGNMPRQMFGRVQAKMFPK